MNDRTTVRPAARPAGPNPTAAAPALPVPPADLYPRFLRAATAAALTGGFTLGALALLSTAWGALFGGLFGAYWVPAVQIHAHWQLFGWVGLFVMGFAYTVAPRLKGTRLQHRPLAVASFWLMLAGLLLRAVAQPLAVYPLAAAGWLLSAAIEVVAISLFALVLLRTLAAATQPREHFDKFLLAGIVWFWVGTLAQVDLVVRAVAAGVNVLPSGREGAFLHLMFVGFAGFFILGVTLRTIPAFMGLYDPRPGAMSVVFWLLNAGLIAFVVGDYFTVPVLAQAGWALESLALLAYVYFLNLFRAPEVPAAEGAWIGGFENMVRAAYGWLVAGSLLGLALAGRWLATGTLAASTETSAFRHIWALGVISMMLMGMAFRMVPIFSGNALHSRKLMLPTFVLLNLTVVLRVLPQLVPVSGTVPAALYGLSGVIGTTALGLFAYNLWRTLGKTPLPMPSLATAPGPSAPPSPPAIAPQAVVAEVLERYPGTLEVFLGHGFEPLRDEESRRTLARNVTVEMACRLHNLDENRFLEELNAARSGDGRSS